MKKFYILAAAVTLLLLAVFLIGKYNHIHTASGGAKFTSRRTVVIDAGHGGRDAGTIGVDGTEEKGINLSMALKLRDYLEVCGIRTELIRDGDYEFYPEGTDSTRSDLYNRLDLVNEIPNAVLISLHQNHFENEAEWGTQIWYSANTPQSKVLADGILTSVKELLQPDNERENKESGSDYYLLYQARVPSVMVECGFMSNRQENEKLKDESYQSDFAYAVLCGICEEV